MSFIDLIYGETPVALFRGIDDVKLYNFLGKGKGKQSLS
jgi:hypothetical protein